MNRHRRAERRYDLIGAVYVTMSQVRQPLYAALLAAKDSSSGRHRAQESLGLTLDLPPDTDACI